MFAYTLASNTCSEATDIGSILSFYSVYSNLIDYWKIEEGFGGGGEEQENRLSWKENLEGLT